MIIIKINKKKLRRLAENVCSIIFMTAFLLLLGITGSCETERITIWQSFIYSLPVLGVMGLAALGLNKIGEVEYE